MCDLGGAGEVALRIVPRSCEVRPRPQRRGGGGGRGGEEGQGRKRGEQQKAKQKLEMAIIRRASRVTSSPRSNGHGNIVLHLLGRPTRRGGGAGGGEERASERGRHAGRARGEGTPKIKND